MGELRRIVWTGLLPVLALAAPGCSGSYAALCEEEIKCYGGNDADIEACIVNADREEEIADIRKCRDQFDEYHECLEAEGRCDAIGAARIFHHDRRCDNQWQRYRDCID